MCLNTFRSRGFTEGLSRVRVLKKNQSHFHRAHVKATAAVSSLWHPSHRGHAASEHIPLLIMWNEAVYNTSLLSYTFSSLRQNKVVTVGEVKVKLQVSEDDRR